MKKTFDCQADYGGKLKAFSRSMCGRRIANIVICHHLCSEHRLRDIINFLPASTFAINKEGMVIALNRAIEALTGFSSRDITGKGNYEYSLALCGERRPMLLDRILYPAVKIKEPYVASADEKDTLLAELEICRKLNIRSFLTSQE